VSSARRGIVWAFALLIYAFPCLLNTPQTSAAVYWGSSQNGLGAANLDGSQPIWDYLYWPYPNESDGPPCGVAVNSTHLYWAGFRGIGRRALEGANVYPGTIVPHLSEPCGIAVDQGHLYWGNYATNSLGRANLDGSEANSALVTGLERPCDVAVGDGRVYWMERVGIGRANLDGSAPEREFVPMPSSHAGCGIAVGGHYLYWGEADSIYRLHLDSIGPPEKLVPEAGGVQGIALDATHVYWNTGDSIGRANLDGSQAQPQWIAGSGVGGGVAVDARPTPPPLTLPSRPILFARSAEYNLHAGAARIGAYVPGQGELRVTSPGLSWKLLRGTVPHPAWAGNFLDRVTFRAGRGPVGKRIRSQLRRRGWAPIALHLEYIQERVYPVTATRRFILRRYPGAAAVWVKHPRPRRPSGR
jgi:hypothetical protein